FSPDVPAVFEFSTVSLHDALPICGQSLAFLQGVSLPSRVLVMGIPYFILGFFLYGSLMAGIGALAPNLREGNSSSFILTLPLILDRKSTRLNSSHVKISYAVFCLK